MITEKQREYNAKYYIEHREKQLKYVSEYYIANRDKILCRRSIDRFANIDEYHRREKGRREKYKEKKRKSKAEWQRIHPENVVANYQKRRARKYGNGGSFTSKEWEDLKTKFDNRCLGCGRDDVKLEADHILPLVMGGTSYISNIQPLCKSCNSKKQSKYIDYR